MNEGNSMKRRGEKRDKEKRYQDNNKEGRINWKPTYAFSVYNISDLLFV